MLRIKSIKFWNHPIFENKEFDFSLYNGSAAENIIIVGENGNGKTNFIKEIETLMLKTNNYKFIDNLEIEIKFDSNDILIPEFDLKNYNIEGINGINGIYIIHDWKNQLAEIKKTFYTEMRERKMIKGFLDSAYSIYNFANLSDNNEYVEKNKRKFYQNLKSYINKKKNEKKENVININIVINGEPYGEPYLINRNKIHGLIINDFSILNDFLLNIENTKTFNSMIFWYDNNSYIWNKIEFFINKLIEDKKIILVDEEIKKIEDSKIINDQIIHNEEVIRVNINKIIDKNLFYDNSNIIENVHEWIKDKLNNVFDNINLSDLNKNLYDLINDSLGPLLNGIKKFFDSKDSNIEISKINWDESDIKEVLFRKNKLEISFDYLSSGEKLILSICMSILNKIKHSNKNWNDLLISHNILLFDEIESGLHPKWQSKILSLIKETSPNVGQRFLTTHSPMICYSINPKTDIIINLNNNENDKIISFKKYSSIQDCVNKSLNFNYRTLSDEHDVWVEGLSDKLYFEIAKSRMNELIPFNILANNHWEDPHGIPGWSGYTFIIKNVLFDFLFNKLENERKKHLIAIVDGDVLKDEKNKMIYNMNFIINKFSKKDKIRKELNKKDFIARIESNINNYMELDQLLKTYENKNDWDKITLNIEKKDGNKILLFQLIILKKDGIENYLESKDKILKNLINDYKTNKSNDKYQIETFVRNDNNKLDTTKLEKILKEISDNVKN